MCKREEENSSCPDVCSDESLCGLAAAGDRLAEERLISKYTRLVRSCARPFFLAGGDSEDLIQEVNGFNENLIGYLQKPEIAKELFK